MKYKVSEWQGAGRVWYAAHTDTKDNKWWMIPRILNISFEKYVQLLLDYNIDGIKYNKEKDCLVFWWKKYSDCHKYVLAINKALRKA